MGQSATRHSAVSVPALASIDGATVATLEELMLEQQRLLEMIVAGQPADDCLTELCRSIERLAPGVHAGVLTVDRSRGTFVRSISPSQDRLLASALGAALGEGWSGTCARAVVTGQTVRCDDIAADERWEASWRDLCVSRGVRASFSTPVMRHPDSPPVASLCLLFDTPRAETAWELRLSRVAAGIAGVVIRRDQTEELRQESERRHQALLDALPVAVYSTDADGAVTYFNKAAAQLWGREPLRGERWCGSHQVLTKDGEVVPEADFAITRVLTGQEEVDEVEVIVERPNGERRQVLAHPRRLTDDVGRTTGAVNLLLDVTERNWAERARSFLAAIVESSEDAIVSKTLEGIVLTWNAGAERLYGFTAEEMIGKPILTVIPDELHHEEETILSSIRANQHIEHFETTRLRKDGRRISISLTVSPIKDRDGRIIGASKIARNISERVETERALRESERKLRLALEAGRMGTWEWSLATNEVKWSSTLEALHGLEAGQFGGTFDAFLSDIHPDDVAKVKKSIDGALRKGRDHHVEYRIIIPDGRTRWLEGRGSVVRDAEGQIAGMMGVCIDITARKASEMAIRESENRFRTMADAAPAMVWLSGADRKHTWFNQRWMEFVGRPMESEVGEGWLENMHEEDVERYISTYHAAFDAGESFSIDYRLRRHDGEYRWVLDCGTPLQDGASSFRGYIGSCIDITDRRNAEAKIRESEARFKLMADAAPVLIWVTDETGKGIYYNERWLSFTGLTLEQMTTQGASQCIHPDDLMIGAMALQEAMTQREPFSVEMRLRRADGRFRWVLNNGVPRVREDGSLAGFIGSCTDITDRKQAEQALRESEARFRTMADNISQFAWMADAAGWIFWYNRRWYEYTGTTLDDMQGWGWEQVHHPDHVDRVVTSWRASIESGEPWEDTFPLRRSDGTYGWFLSRAQPIKDESGRILRWFGTNTEVTEQRRLQEELAEHKADLEVRVEERTRELKQTFERLRLAERMAMMGTLSAGLGHDLGNLLVPVRVRLDSLAHEPLSDQAREDVEAIQGAADYLKRLAGGLRLLAIDPERSPRGEVSELSSWWNDTRGVLKSVLPSGVELVADLPEEACSAEISRAALTQVVFNLVQNAGDVLRERGRGRVLVRARLDGEEVVIEVTDDGPGMSEHVLARCMEPFFTTKTRGMSTGLGLVLVFGLVKDAGGTVHPSSEVGQGTTFTIRLRKAAESPAVRAAAGSRRALVDIRDARLRSFLTGELKAMRFDVRNSIEGGEKVDVMFVDPSSQVAWSESGIQAVYLGEAEDVSGSNVRVLGARPSMSAIKEVLRAVEAMSGSGTGETRSDEPVS